MVDPKSGKYDLLPHVAPGNIESFTGRLYDNVKLVGEENLISGKFVFNVGDIVYGKINPQLGKYVFARFSGLTSADAYVLNAKNGIVQKFLYAVIQTRDFYDYSVSVSKRSGMPKINRDELNAYSYWAPSESEQLKIGEYLLTLDHLITLHQRQPFLHSPPDISLIVQLTPPFYTFSWEQRKAIDIADYSKGNGYSKGDLTDAGTPIILYGRLYTKYQFAISEVDTFAVPRNGAVYSQGNEVIVPASGETAEDIARASAVEKSGVLLGGDLNILRPFDFINPLFLALAISNGEPQKELAKKAQGKSVVHIHNTDIQEVTIVYPSRTEQDRIVSVFRQLDHLITLHQRKFEKLTNVKKSMLEKMFPQNGSSYPEIRFKGFTDPWEQRKLGELVDVCSGRDYKHLSEGTIPVYGTGGYMLSVNDALSYDRDAIGIGRKGTIDRPYILKAPFWTVDTLFYAIPREKADLNFAFDIFQNIDWKKKDESTGVPSLSKTAINDIDVLAPKHGEQQTIGQFFAAIDHLITLHQRELEKLQNIKKSMLEKMFV